MTKFGKFNRMLSHWYEFCTRLRRILHAFFTSFCHVFCHVCFVTKVYNIGSNRVLVHLQRGSLDIQLEAVYYWKSLRLVDSSKRSGTLLEPLWIYHVGVMMEYISHSSLLKFWNAPDLTLRFWAKRRTPFLHDKNRFMLRLRLRLVVLLPLETFIMNSYWFFPGNFPGNYPSHHHGFSWKNGSLQ